MTKRKLHTSFDKDITEHDDVTLNSNTSSITNDVTKEYEDKMKKEKVEDTHERTTFLFRKDLKKRLDKVTKNKRGYKTLIMNKAIAFFLDEMDKEEMRKSMMKRSENKSDT